MSPILAEGQDPFLVAPVSLCAMCERKLKSSCIREVRVELTLTEEGGGGMAPDIILGDPDTTQSLLFCSLACAREAAKTVASEIQNPMLRNSQGDPHPKGEYTFPGHLPFRGKIEKWDIHFTKIGPASYDDGQNSRGAF